MGLLVLLQVILSLISTRVEKGICDEVLKVAWSMLWNVTGNLFIVLNVTDNLLVVPNVIGNLLSTHCTYHTHTHCA